MSSFVERNRLMCAEQNGMLDLETVVMCRWGNEMTKEQYERLKENVFELMCGDIDAVSTGIENEFADGEMCDRIYEEIYTLMDANDDNPETAMAMEKMMALHSEILRHLCYKMFDYGYCFNTCSCD